MPKSEMPQPQQEPGDQPLSPSLWSEYVNEMHGVQSLERNYGFITYKIDGELGHVIDMFIKPEFRNGAYRRMLFREMTEILKNAGVTQALGQVQAGINGATRRVSFWLTIGAEVYKADRNVIYFVKRL